AVELRYLRGCRVAEVARQMGRSKEAVAKLLLRGVARLRERLDEPSGGGAMPAERDGTLQKESLDTVLVACLEAIEEGRPPDREALLVRYPEFAEDLAQFLDGHERIDRCTAPVRAAVLSHFEPASFGDYELIEEI